MFQVINTLYQRANLKRFFKNIKKNSLKILHISIFTNFPKLPPGWRSALSPTDSKQRSSPRCGSWAGASEQQGGNEGWDAQEISARGPLPPEIKATLQLGSPCGSDPPARGGTNVKAETRRPCAGGLPDSSLAAE